MERRKKRVKGLISVEKLSIGKTENSLESVSMDTYEREQHVRSPLVCAILIISQSVEYFKSSGMLSVYLLSWS